MKILNFTLKLLIFNFALLTILANPVHAGELANQFTVSIWVNPQTSIASKALVVKDTEIRLVTDSSGNPVCQIHNGTDWQTAVTSSTVLTTGSWAHVSCAYNKSNMYVYINGVQTGSGTQTATVNDAATNLLAGQDDSGTYGNLIGSVDQIQVYSYARTQKQIVEDMNAGHPAVGSPVGSAVAHWKLDEGYGTTANDTTPNANNLTLSSASWTDSGKFGKAWNGTGAIWLSKADDSDFDFTATDDFAISLWFKSDSANNPGAVEYLFSKGPTSAAGYAVYANTSGNLCLGIDDDAIWGPDVGSCTSTDVYDNSWHHLVGVRDTTQDKTYIYIDGLKKDSDTDPTTATLANSATLYAGDLNGSNDGNEFNGDLDEIKVYKYALTADEAKTEYNRGSSLVLGSLSDNSSYQANAANQEYCVPGDSTSCAAPVARWDFEEKTGQTAYDTSGNGFNATLGANSSSGSDDPTWTNGKIGGALKFDGTNDYAFITDNALLKPATFTISFWVKKNSEPDNWNRIMEKLDGTTAGWSILFDNLATKKAYLATKNTAGSEYNTNSVNTALPVGIWKHYAYVFDGSKIYPYENGIPLTSITFSGTYNPASTNLAFGSTAGPGSFGPITLDQVRIFNYARSAAQVAWDYNRGAPVGHWKFDECQGTTANDSSGNSNTGTITIGTSGTQTAVGACTSSGAWYNGVSGKRNYSLNFDGTDDYVTGTDLDVSNAITLSAWVKTSSNSTQIIIRKTNTYELAVMNSSACPGVVDGSVTMIIGTGSIWGCPTSIYSASGTSSVGDSSWHHLVGTFDDPSNTIRIYIDGKLQTTYTSATVSFGTNNNTLYIGSNRDGGSTLDFSGQIDDVRVYNYALTATQIKNLYNGGAVNFAPNTGAP